MQELRFKPISFEEYNKIRKILLVGSEAIEEEVYRDGDGIATIGIGINIGGKNLEGLWLRLILYYLFGLVKDVKDIPFIQFDDYKYSFKRIIKDTTSHKYQEYKKLIDKIADKMLTTLQTDINTSTLNNIIKENIESYRKHTLALNAEQRQQRLNETDLKIDKSNPKNPQYLEFRLNKEQAEELFKIMVINYEAITLNALNNKKIHIFDKFKEKDISKREYYKEFIPFVSATYQAPNAIKNNALIQKAFNSYKSRFFIWGIIRYVLGNKKRRRILQSALFNFNGKLANEAENDNEKWQTCIDIFKVLNLLKESVNAEEKQTYFAYFKKQEQTMAKAIQGEQNTFNIRNSKKHLNNPDYAIYRSNHINPSELQPLQNILTPYAQFLDKLIPNATFESNADFKRYNLFSIDLKKDSTNNQSTNNHPHNNQLNEQEAKQQDSNIESRFKLENIYIIDKSNYNEALRAIKDYHNTSLTTENLLVIFIDTIESEIKIHKPNNTYLYLVSIKDNHIDCSFINNPLKECNLPNDKAELYLYKTQENNLPKITSLATQELTLKQEDNKELSAKENNLTYSFNGFNQLTIKQEEAILLTLSNYHFLLKQRNTTNTDSNNTTNNTDKTNNNAISKDSNNTNKNDENAMLEDSYSNKDSSNPYTLKTHLQPNQSYSTLGIQLLSPQEQDTFSNNGNFSIHLKHINLICIENQTNNTITQDTPIFCYVQENKQTFITKLQDNELTLNINIDKNITKDSKGKIEPINTKNIFLSFIPFKDSTQANNTFSQKLQLTSTDLNKGNITKDFKIPYCKIQDCEEFGEWEK